MSLSNLPRKEYMKDQNDCGDYLKRMQSFLDILGNPERRIPHYIHIAGTSGKGSVASFLYAILDAADKPAGLYLSPHARTITERWQANRKMMTRSEFARVTQVMQTALNEYLRVSRYEPPSFFDVCTAMALYWFAEKKISWAVIETGCGGMYDSTNVIPRKDIAVITPIGLDHTELLGKTTSAIARRKAGIIKGSCAVFTNEPNKKLQTIIKKTCTKKNTFTAVEPRYEITYAGLDGTEFIYENRYFHIPCFGRHQVNNAILAAGVARAIGISEPSIQSGLHTASLPFRLEVVHTRPTIIVDGAHNPEKMKATVEAVKEIVDTPIRLIVGFSGNKDMVSMVAELSKLKPVSIACTRNTVNQFRKVAHPNYIATLIQAADPNQKPYITADPADALTWSKKRLKKNETLLITGSLFLSGEIRNML